MRPRAYGRGLLKHRGLLVGLCLAATACAWPTSVPTPPASPPPIAGTAPAPGPDWPTYQRDLARSGIAPGSTFTRLTRAWQSATLDGSVYAQPLVVNNQVLVATEGDSVYALDAVTGRERWRAHLGESVPRSALPCGNIDPVGITSTPVVDPQSGLVYAVAFIQPGRHELFAIALDTGTVRFHRSIDPPGANPLVSQQRAALSLSQGMIYVPYGGLFGDCGDYAGWVVGARADGSGTLASYRVQTVRRGGIWAPGGAAVDAAGDLFVATGNTISTSTFDFGNSVIRLSPDLRVQDWFAPNNWVDLNRQDADLGSTTPTILDGGLIFQIGKSGLGYLLRAQRLGGIGGQAFASNVCSGGYGATAYAPPYLYVPCSDGLVGVRMSSEPSFTVVWRGPRFFAGPPILAGGAVWTISRNGELYGLDPTNGQVRFRESVGPVMHFAAPAAAGGWVFVPASTSVIAFGGT